MTQEIKVLSQETSDLRLKVEELWNALNGEKTLAIITHSLKVEKDVMSWRKEKKKKKLWRDSDENINRQHDVSKEEINFSGDLKNWNVIQWYHVSVFQGKKKEKKRSLLEPHRMKIWPHTRRRGWHLCVESDFLTVLLWIYPGCSGFLPHPKTFVI